MRRALALLLLLAAVPAAASKWTVVPATSSIGFKATWLGKPVLGQFGKWTAAIDFDPAAPARARIAVDVDLASASTGDRTVDGALPGDDWFAVKAARTARFVATRVTAAGPNRFVAAGTLTIRGVAVPVTLPFALTVKGNDALMTGQVQLDRRAWKLGMGSDATAEYVDFAVPLTVRVTAKRAP